MRGIRRPFRINTYCVLLMLSICLPPGICCGGTFCLARNVKETLSNMSLTSMMGMSPYTFHYDLTVT